MVNFRNLDFACNPQGSVGAPMGRVGQTDEALREESVE